MNPPKFVVIFVTASSADEAKNISLTLVEERLAACANIAPNINSVYWWNGKIENAGEQLIIIKSVAARLDAVIARVKSLHSYKVPEIVALPVIGVNSDYLKWIENSVNS